MCLHIKSTCKAASTWCRRVHGSKKVRPNCRKLRHRSWHVRQKVTETKSTWRLENVWKCLGLCLCVCVCHSISIYFKAFDENEAVHMVILVIIGMIWHDNWIMIWFDHIWSICINLLRPRTITVVSDTNLVPLLAMYGLKHASSRFQSFQYRSRCSRSKQTWLPRFSHEVFERNLVVWCCL